MTTNHKGYYDVTGTIKDLPDGTARLRVVQEMPDGSRRLWHNKIHKDRKAALAAWYRENA